MNGMIDVFYFWKRIRSNYRHACNYRPSGAAERFVCIHAECPLGFTDEPALGQCYMRVDTPMTWQQAWAHCRSHNRSSLLHITFYIPFLEEKALQNLLTSCKSF